jgi:hypothetical protein
MRRFVAAVCAVLLAGAGTAAGAENEARGTLKYEGKSGPVTVTVTHAYLFKGPDIVSGRTMRRLVLSTEDISAKLAACGSMMCSDGGIWEGMTVDFDAGPRLNYWFVANGQLIQYSGTADPASAKLSADAPDRLAGTLNLDGRTAGGPLVQVEFDARLVKDVKK